MTKREKASELVRIAFGLQDEGRLPEAVSRFQAAAGEDPGWSAPLFNLGLIFKRQRNWMESFEYNRRATDLDATNDAAWWNLGIAATALGRWKSARSAWHSFGIAVPDGEGPIDFPCGFGPIRLNPEGEGEVVWAFRLDPARAALASIPFPESGHRWRDVVLNDGAPNGYRNYKGKELPVFDVLELLERSRFVTFVARVVVASKAGSVLRLAELAAKLGGSAEDWSTSVRMICKACSEGRPHASHDVEGPRVEGAHVIGIAAHDRVHASAILDAWTAEGEPILIESLDDTITTGPSAS
jgi:hypothetical protein